MLYNGKDHLMTDDPLEKKHTNKKRYVSIMLFGRIRFMIVQLRYIHTQDGKHVNDTNLKINCLLSICHYTGQLSSYTS